MKEPLLIVLCAFLAGCTWTRPVQVAQANMPVSATPGSYRTVGPSEGKSCETHLFGVFLMGPSSRLQAAIDDALQASGGGALVGMTVDEQVSNFLILTKSCMLVRGLAIEKAGPGEAAAPRRAAATAPLPAAAPEPAAAAEAADEDPVPAGTLTQDDAIKIYLQHLRKGDRVEVSFKPSAGGFKTKPDGQFLFLSAEGACAMLQPARGEGRSPLRACAREIENIQKVRKPAAGGQ